MASKRLSQNNQVDETVFRLLVWAYQKQKADLVTQKPLWSPGQITGIPDVAADTGIRRSSGCGCVQLEKIHRLGASIPSTGQGAGSDLHPDAEKLHELMIAFSKKHWLAAAQLLHTARLGSPPDWFDGEQVIYPVYDEDSNIVTEIAETVPVQNRNKEVVQVEVLCCPLEFYPDASWIEMRRQEYLQWFSALRKFSVLLAKNPLQKWRISGLGAIPQPWGVMGMSAAGVRGRRQSPRFRQLPRRMGVSADNGTGLGVG